MHQSRKIGSHGIAEGKGAALACLPRQTIDIHVQRQHVQIQKKEFHCHLCLFDLFLHGWKRTLPERNKSSSISWKKNIVQMEGSESSRSALSQPYSSPLPILLVGLLTCHSGHSAAPGWQRVIKVLFGQDEGDIRGARKEGCAREIDGKRWIWAVLKTIFVPSKGENGVGEEEVESRGMYSVKEDDIASGHSASPAAPELF